MKYMKKHQHLKCNRNKFSLSNKMPTCKFCDTNGTNEVKVVYKTFDAFLVAKLAFKAVYNSIKKGTFEKSFFDIRDKNCK